MTAQIIKLGSLDENDEDYTAFLEQLKDGNSRGVFIIEREDGSVAVGSNASERGELVYDLFRLQKLIEQLVLSE